MSSGSSRLQKELNRLKQNPPEGIACYEQEDKSNLLSVTIVGPNGSPYEGGIFKLQVEVDGSYPFKPPHVRFITPVYHPNIDEGGRICMDLLKLPPTGGWNPTITLESLFVAVKLLLGDPNPNDPLIPEIAKEYISDRLTFEKKAHEYTKTHAK